MSELYYAEMEAARNEAEDLYFAARPRLLKTADETTLFRAGFERAFSPLWNRLQAVTRQCTSEQQTKPPQERAEKSPDDKHAWEFEPHYDSDFDVLVCPHENAWDELVKVVEAVYDNMEAGEERTITLRFNGEKP